MSFHFQLELANGEPADPPHFATSTPNWRPGDPVFIAPGRSYRVLEVRRDDEDGAEVLAVRPD